MEKRTSLQTADRRDNPQTRERTSFTCNECGKKFEEPTFTSISSQGIVQTYYACPRCLSKINEDEEIETEKNEALAAPEEPEKCQHFLGYLKERPKETAIPEDCLICERMIECMATTSAHALTGEKKIIQEKLETGKRLEGLRVLLFRRRRKGSTSKTVNED